MSGHSKWSSIKHKKGAADAEDGESLLSRADQRLLARKREAKQIA